MLAGLAVALPLLALPLPATHDGLHHLFRLFQLDETLRGWHLYPRLFPDMGFGYGYPVLNYYSPLSYYVAWVATAFGSGYIGGIRVAHTVGLLLGGLTMYAWVCQSLPRPAALLAAVAYSAFPYRVADVYVRGALAESLAFVFPPLILWLGTLLVRRRQARWATALALTAAGFILTHNLTAFMFAPVIAGFLLLEAGCPSATARRAYLGLAVAALLGLALSAFFWLPALRETQYVLAGQVGEQADVASQLQPLREWFSPFVLHRYFPEQGVGAQHPFGLVQAALALTGLAAIVLRRRSLPLSARRLLWFAFAVTLATTLLLLPLSSAAWESLPLLPYLQFPWRLQAVLTLSTAVLAAANVLWLTAERPRELLVALASSAVVVAGLAGLALEPARMPGHEEPLREADVSQQGLVEYDFQTALWLREHGGEWLLEYLPRWALAHRSDFFLPAPAAEQPPAQLAVERVTVHSHRPLAEDLTVILGSPGPLVWHRFYFPGWRVTVDGRAAEARPEGPLGLLAVDLPAGEHRVQLRYGLTSAATVGALLSLLGLAVTVGLAAVARSRLPWPLLGVAALGLALVAGRAHAYPTTQNPSAIDATLGESLRLVAYQAEQQGAQLEVTLYWLALQSPDQDYRVFVHAVGDDGEMLAQHDGQPGLEFSPTTRWVAGELMVDRHYLALPPGPVTLYAGMYTLPEVTNLPVRQDGHEVPDGRVLVGRWSAP